jgi:hypothetical protein
VGESERKQTVRNFDASFPAAHYDMRFSLSVGGLSISWPVYVGHCPGGDRHISGMRVGPLLGFRAAHYDMCFSLLVGGPPCQRSQSPFGAGIHQISGVNGTSRPLVSVGSPGTGGG